MQPSTQTPDTEAIRKRKEQYKAVVFRIWALFKVREIDDLEANMLGNQLMRYYAHLPLEEVYEAFATMLVQLGADMPKHFGELTWEWMASILKLYLDWRTQERYRQKVERARTQQQPEEMSSGPPSPQQREKMEKEIITKAYNNFCEGKLVCLVPRTVYDILVRRGRIPADAYKAHLQRAVDIKKAREMASKKDPKRGEVIESIGEQLAHGLDMTTDSMAKDYAIRLYFEEFRTKKLANGPKNESNLPQVRVEQNAQQR